MHDDYALRHLWPTNKTGCFSMGENEDLRQTRDDIIRLETKVDSLQETVKDVVRTFPQQLATMQEKVQQRAETDRERWIVALRENNENTLATMREKIDETIKHLKEVQEAKSTSSKDSWVKMIQLTTILGFMMLLIKFLFFNK